MANCHICEHLAICPWASPQEIVCSSFKRKPITNADRIRSMTDEELAKLIHDIVQAEMWRVQVRECITTDAGWLDWLKQEATD